MRRTVALIALFLLVLAAGRADAAFRPLEPRVDRLLTDRERFAVAVRVDASLAIFDDRGPAPGLAPPCASGTLQALGAGQAVFECPRTADGSIDVRMVDLATRAERTPVGLDALDRQAEAGARPYDVGRHWMAVSMEGHRGSYTRFLNWRTGAVREDPVLDARRGVRPDLDRSDLDRPLCAPLRRRFMTVDQFFGTGETIVWRPADYGAGRALIGSRVYRCGRRRARVLRRADPNTPRLTAGRITWREGADLVVEPLGDGARRTRLPLPAGMGYLAQTGRRIFFVEIEGGRTLHMASAPRG